VGIPALTLTSYLAQCRDLVLAEIQEIIPNNRYRPILYDLMLEYPLRGGKAFRPSLCIATCRALGGRLQDVMRTAAVLELYHNAFLIHDDVEDGSLMRRGFPTLHHDYGAAIAVNVGDGMNALCLQPLLDNMGLLGMGKALRILQIIANMARESVEGQAMELDWVHHKQWNIRDRDYILMSYKKSCWYTFIAPMHIGAIITSGQPSQLSLLRRFAIYIGVAFQIQDDVLNLIADEGLYGKEIGGDLWEGKRTLILLHMMRTANPDEQATARRILERPRNEKTADDIRYLYSLIHAHGSIDYARNFARRFANKAEQILFRAYAWMPPSVHRDFLLGMAEYVISRDK
jgi:geranylgeranyl diphosphate synthase, type II